MKKIIKQYTIAGLALLSLMTGACVKSAEEWNLDTKNASTVPAYTLFTGATKNLVDVITTPATGTNPFRFYVQYWTMTEYLDMPRYNLDQSTLPQNFWQIVYKDILADFAESRKITEADELLDPVVKQNELAQIEILSVYAWSILVNTFGNVPYTEAMNPDNVLPVFDDAHSIYLDLLSRLNTAIGQLDTQGESFGSADPIYGGNMGQWVKFANTLKVKLAMVVADSDENLARQYVGEAYDKGFESNADNAVFQYMAANPNNNPISGVANPLFTSRQDFVVTSIIVDPMNELSDPRRSAYFTTVGGTYRGGDYGFTNVYGNFSTMSTTISDPLLEGVFADYSEFQFNLAEAAERWGNVGASAASYYENGIRASISYWGGSEAATASYLAQPTVAYTSAQGDYKQKIGMQKWYALYNRGYDAWIEWRRLDYPVLYPPTVSADGEDFAPSGLSIPVRLIYPLNEQGLNGDNLAAAASAIGGDLVTTKLFWDIF